MVTPFVTARSVAFSFYAATPKNPYSGRRMHYIHHLHQRYGSVVRIAPNEVAVADLEAFSQIHRIGSGFQEFSL